MLIRSAPSACVIAASTPGPVGDVDAHAVQRARRRRTRCSSIRRRLPAASPIQRARKPASPCVERGLDLLDPAAVLGERLADRLGVVEEDVDPDARVRAGDARHVAQRAAGVRERLVALDARRARLVDDHVREHVRHVARQRDEPVVRGRVDRDRHRAELGDEAVDEAVALGVGLRRRRRGTTSRRRRCPAEACSAPRASEPQIGWPPTKRGEPRRRRDDARLRRADVGDGRLLAPPPRAPPRPRPAAPRSAPRRPRARRPRAPPRARSPCRRPRRARPRRRARAGSASQPSTRAPRSFAARPIEAPISPVPTTVSRVTIGVTGAASARRGGTRGRATAARSGAGRRASRSGGRAATRVNLDRQAMAMCVEERAKMPEEACLLDDRKRPPDVL